MADEDISRQKLDLTDEDIRRRKDFLELDDRDIELLRELHHKLDVEEEGILDEFYAHLKSFSFPRQLLDTPESTERLKRLQKRSFHELTTGDYDSDYIDSRLRIGLVHQRIGLEPHWYISGFRFLLHRLHLRLVELYSDDPQRGRDVFAALCKMAFFDMGLAIDTYIFADRQRAVTSEQGFRDVIEHSPDGIVIHRGARIVYVNPVLTRLLNVDGAENIVGASIFDYIDAAEADMVRDRIDRLRRTREPNGVMETTLVSADGSRLEVEVSSVPLQFDGEAAIVSMVRDITDRKHWDARMMRMDRMIAAGTLAAGVGHEINNPLTYISTNQGFARRQLAHIDDFSRQLEEVLVERLDTDTAEQILEDLAPDRLTNFTSGIREALDDADHGTQRIRDIVDQLRSLARTDDEGQYTVEPTQMLEWAISMASNEIRHRARLVRDFDDIPPLKGRESRLGQVFLNLLVNAAHAVEEGAARENEIRITARRSEGDMMLIAIEDTGKGIAPEHLERIFDPFFTTKDVGEGTGLGLHICQSIVQSYGGRLEVDSTVGEGTRFTVFLPICTVEEPSAPDADDAEAALDTNQGGRILVVDDESRFRKALRRVLKRHHDVVTAESGDEALRRLSTDDKFDLILCDLMMPQTTGMDLFRAVKRRHPSYADRVVFMSGGAFTRRARQFLEQTDNPYIEKPFDYDDLAALLEEFVDH